MPADSNPVITVTLRIRGAGADDYGIVRIAVPASQVDWSLADGPRDRVTLADIYQVDIAVGRPGEPPDTDTWDRA